MTRLQTPSSLLPALLSRREFIVQAGALSVAASLAGCQLTPPASPTPTPYPAPTYVPTVTISNTFTDWGWPLPYDQVSTKSVHALQNRGWWPLVFGHQDLWSGDNAVQAMMKSRKLPALRGLNVQFLSFPDEITAVQEFVSDRLQVCTMNSGPIAQLIHSGAPVALVAVITPNLGIATVVPNASPLQALSQIKGSGDAIGVVHNSLADTYFVVAAELNGLRVGYDFYFKALILREEAALPDTVSAVVPREPVASEIVEQRRTGRRIDVVFPYIFSHGYLVVRRELVELAPDVVQALVDSYVEGVLFVRLAPQNAATLLAQTPSLRKYAQAFLLEQTQAYNNLYKPTFMFPFNDFWSLEDSSLTNALVSDHQLTAPLDASTWQRSILPTFAQNSFARLGWRVPNHPPWIPDNWSGHVGRRPYPAYLNVTTLRRPQTWPEPSDLSRPWKFAGTTYYP